MPHTGRQSNQVLTKLRELNAKLGCCEMETLFKFSADMLFVIKSGLFVKINESVSSILGWDKNYILDSPLIDFVADDDRDEVDDAINNSARNDHIELVSKFKCKDGALKTLQWRCNRLENNNNVYIVARDITEIRAVKDALCRLEEKYNHLLNINSLSNLNRRR